MKKIYFILLTILIVSLTACTSQFRNFGSLHPIRFENILSKSGVVLIDIRTEQELKQTGIISGAINIDYYQDDFIPRLNNLDPSLTYLIYSAHANRSKSALDTMQAIGFREVYDLKGGIASRDPNKLVKYIPTAQTDTHFVDVYLAILPILTGTDNLEDYLTTVEIGLQNPVETTEQKIASSLDALLTLAETGYGVADLHNLLYASDAYVESIGKPIPEQDHVVIDLSGTILPLNPKLNPLIKLQITKTIELYSSDYEILLNGSAKEWEKLFE